MIEIDRDLKDMIISAFRYSLGRKTYITWSTCDYIKEHKELVDKRLKTIMLSDLQSLDMYYVITDMDYKIFKDFEKWLNELEVQQ